MVELFYTTYISVDFAYHELFCAKPDGVVKRLILSRSRLKLLPVIFFNFCNKVAALDCCQYFISVQYI